MDDFKPSNMQKLAALFGVELRTDGFVNTVTGLGLSNSKAKATDFIPAFLLQAEKLEALYAEEIPAKIVDTIVDDATREGFDLKIEGDDDQEIASDLTDIYDDRGYGPKVEQAAKWGRLFGWGGLLMVTSDVVGNPFQGGGARMVDPLPNPLPPNLTLKNLILLERKDVQVMAWDTDPLSPNWGNPKTYRIMPHGIPGMAGTMAIVDASRIIQFHGDYIPRNLRTTNYGFHLSVLQRIYDTIAQYGISWEAIATLLQDATQGVYKISNLMQTVAAGNEGWLKSRLQIMDKTRGVNNAIVIDKDKEEFTREDFSFTGYDKVIQEINNRLAMAAGMPVTVLFGISPAGMNATGESDMRLWENKVKAFQRRTLIPAWTLLFKLIGNEKSLGEKSWCVEPKPLRQMTLAEIAEIRSKVAAADTSYVNAQVLTPEEVAINRFGPKGWSIETQIDPEIRAKIVEADLEHALETAENPPVPPAPGQTPPGQDTAAPPPAPQAKPPADGSED